VLGEIRDDRIRCEEVHRFSTGAIKLPSGLYWDPLGMFTEIKFGLRAATKSIGTRIGSVSVDTWGIDFALLDHDGGLLSNPSCYRDARTEGMMDEVLERLGRWEVFEQSGGIQHLSINTLYQLYSMVRRRSPLLRAAHTFVMMPDLFHYWLSGQKAVEFTNATTTQFFDATRRAWALDLLDTLEIPSGLLPNVVSPGTVLGPIIGSVAEELGWSRDTKVVAGATHDTASAAVAIPAGPDACWISSGTWSLVGAFSGRPIVTRKAMDWNISSYGGVDGAFLPLRNVMGLWLLQQCRSAWLRQGAELSFRHLADLAEGAEPFRAIIDPDHPTFLAPPDMLAAICSYCQATGQYVPETKAETTRLILEGLALRYRWTIDRLRALALQEFSALHIVGGGARNGTLCQFAADATGLPVVAGPEEATAMGNIAVQAMAAGEVGNATEIRELVKRTIRTAEYEPRRSDGWEDAYERFCLLVGKPGSDDTADDTNLS